MGTRKSIAVGTLILLLVLALLLNRSAVFSTRSAPVSSPANGNSSATTRPAGKAAPDSPASASPSAPAAESPSGEFRIGIAREGFLCRDKDGLCLVALDPPALPELGDLGQIPR